MPIIIIEYDTKSLILLIKLITIPNKPNVINPKINSESL